MTADDQTSDYDDVRKYTLAPEREQDLLEYQSECTFIWVNKAGHPLGVIMSYIARDGHFWLTATSSRQRIPAIRRDGRSSIAISSLGTQMGPKKSITYKGASVIRDDRATKDWFYPALALRLQGHRGEARMAQYIDILNTPERVIIEFTPESDIRFDGDKMYASTPPVTERQ